MLLHEASIIATRERAEMKMSEFFIERKIVVDGAGHSITKRRAVKPLNASNRTQHQSLCYTVRKAHAVFLVKMKRTSSPNAKRSVNKVNIFRVDSLP